MILSFFFWSWNVFAHTTSIVDRMEAMRKKWGKIGSASQLIIIYSFDVNFFFFFFSIHSELQMNTKLINFYLLFGLSCFIVLFNNSACVCNYPCLACRKLTESWCCWFVRFIIIIFYSFGRGFGREDLETHKFASFAVNT